jgi:excisionase family DNA binding protein
MTDRLTLSIEDAAEALGIGRGLAYEMARTGKLPVLKLGRRLVVPRAQLEAMVQGSWPPEPLR